MITNTLKTKIKAALSYTNRDYDSIMASLESLFNANPELKTLWNNFSQADILYIMMHIMAGHLDIINYMMDYRTLEGYMSTAKERQSLVRIADSFGFKIGGFKPSSAEFVLSQINNEIPSENVTVAPFTTFIDSNNKTWVYTGEQDATLGATADEAIRLFEGRVITRSFTLSELSLTNQTKIITDEPIAIGNTYNTKGCSRVYNETLGLFTEVPNLNEYAGDNPYVYELNTDPQGVTYIRFSPALDYVAHSVKQLSVSLLVTSGNSVQSAQAVSATIGDKNVTLLPLQGTFYLGENALEEADIRKLFKQYIVNPGQLITIYDYKNFILDVQKVAPNITKCLVIDKSDSTRANLYGDNTNFDPWEIGIYVTDENNSLAPEYITELTDLLNSKKVAPVKLLINNDDNLVNKLETVSLFVQLYVSEADSNNTNNIAQLKQLVVDYINTKNIGDNITNTELQNIITSSNYAQLFPHGITSLIGQVDSLDIVYGITSTLDYYQVATITVDQVEIITAPISVPTSALKTITYRTIEPDALITTMSYKSGALISGHSVANPTKAGNVFVGWSESNIAEYDIVELPLTLTDNITLYARFEPVYTISYIAQDAFNVPPISYYQGDTQASISDIIPVKTGHVFSHWEDNLGNEYSSSTEPFVLTASLQLYAIWNLVEYLVAYNPGTTENVAKMPSPLTFNKLHGIGHQVSPLKPSRIDYLFSYWRTLINGQAVTVPVWGFYNFDVSTTLTAVWHRALPGDKLLSFVRIGDTAGQFDPVNPVIKFFRTYEELYNNTNMVTGDYGIVTGNDLVEVQTYGPQDLVIDITVAPGDMTNNDALWNAFRNVLDVENKRYAGYGPYYEVCLAVEASDQSSFKWYKFVPNGGIPSAPVSLADFFYIYRKVAPTSNVPKPLME